MHSISYPTLPSAQLSYWYNQVFSPPSLLSLVSSNTYLMGSAGGWASWTLSYGEYGADYYTWLQIETGTIYSPNAEDCRWFRAFIAHDRVSGIYGPRYVIPEKPTARTRGVEVCPDDRVIYYRFWCMFPMVLAAYSKWRMSCLTESWLSQIKSAFEGEPELL